MSVPGELEGSVRDNFYRRQNPSLSLCIFNSFCPQSTFVPVQVKVFLVVEKNFSFFSRSVSLIPFAVAQTEEICTAP